MITLIGTGHVFDLSDALLQVFDELQPDTICVELDQQRYQQLLMKRQQQHTSKKIPRDVPFLYRVLARFQQNLAKKYGVTPGEEMVTAIQYAQNHQLPMHLIDMNAQTVFSQMLRNMTLKEKFRLLLSGVGGLFVSQKRVETELDKIQGDFTSYLDQIGKKFPTIKESLIDKRNLFMVNKLLQLNKEFDQIAVCVGDGHIPGMSLLLEKEQVAVETIRLKQLQDMPKKDFDPSSASFHVQYHHDDG